MEAFYEGLFTGPTQPDVGPPTDSTMPCYDEIVAAWDAGCRPYLW